MISFKMFFSSFINFIHIETKFANGWLWDKTKQQKVLKASSFGLFFFFFLQYYKYVSTFKCSNWYSNSFRVTEYIKYMFAKVYNVQFNSFLNGFL